MNSFEARDGPCGYLTRPKGRRSFTSEATLGNTPRIETDFDAYYDNEKYLQAR